MVISEHGAGCGKSKKLTEATAAIVTVVKRDRILRLEIEIKKSGGPFILFRLAV
jgi:hypothetical protein